MPATPAFSPPTTKPLARTRGPAGGSRQTLWLVALIAAAGLTIWARTAGAATSLATTTTALAPGLQLATGTVQLEGTEQAVDSASAAKLLPLWQLLEQLSTSSTTAPEEITAVVEEIQLNMTPAQITAIEAMSTDKKQANASSAASATASPKSNTQAAAADPGLGGIAGGPPGGMPMDGGGPPGNMRTSSSSATTSSGASEAPAEIQQVIRLLETKLQG